LPLIPYDCRICSEYDSASEARIPSIKVFFDQFHIEPRRGILYHYFYNDRTMKEWGPLEEPSDSK
jgi:hypothetical protein